jgi:hypothetical protein
VRGRIVFHTAGGDMDLGPEDKMVLPPHTPHAATVGAEGVRRIETPRPAGLETSLRIRHMTCRGLNILIAAFSELGK